MNCREAEQLLQGRLDGEAPGVAHGELERHLRECAVCRMLHATAERLQEGLPRWAAAVTPPAGLAERIVLRVQAERKRRRRWISAAALAAGLLLATFISQVYRPQSKPLAINTPSAPDPQPDLVLPVEMQEAKEAVMSATKLAADETLHQGSVLLPLVSPKTALPDSGVLSSVLESPTQAIWEVTESVTSGLEPVTSSARRAVDLFLKDGPPGP
jgi:hypothetical protein